MSSSPAEQDWLDDTLPLPQAGLIWPWILVGSIMFTLGMYLLWPSLHDRPGRAATPDPVTVSDLPSSMPTVISPTPDSPSWNFLFVDSTTSSFAHAAEDIDRELRKDTQGRLGLTLHPSGLFQGQKLDEMGIIEQIRKGQAQIGLVTCSPLTNSSAVFEVFDLPFLIQSYEQADRVLLGPIGQSMLKTLEDKGLVGLGTLEVGFRVFSSSVPLPTLADFRGKRVRVMQSSMAIQMARQLGCEAVPAPVDKIYQMGKEGYIDAADRTYPTYWDFKLYEVQRYITESRHSYTTKVIIMNKQAYLALDENARRQLRAAVQSAAALQRKRQREEDLRVKQECRRQGIEIFELSPQERARFLQACQPLYAEYDKLRGPELVQSIRAAATP